MRAAGLLLIALAACDSSLYGLGDDRAPLAVVRGRYDGPLPVDVNTHLRAALIWAGPPVFVPYCHQHGPTPIEPDRTLTDVSQNGCRDPFEFVPSSRGPSVALDLKESREFEIPLQHLPDATSMVGTLEARVAYASLVIYDDRDDDQLLELGSRCPRRDRNDPHPDPLEPLYASSFSRLNATQTRIAYVEGEFDADSFYYPHPNCTALPPRGFSVWTVGDLLDPSAACSVSPIDAPITLDYTAPEHLNNLACLPSERESFTRPPPGDGPGRDVVFECTENGAVAVADPLCPCPNLRVYALRGCFDDAACATPDWDIDPPEGWPCAAP